MAYDERAVALTEELQRLIGYGGPAHHRCGAILNALEVMVEEDTPAPDPVALRLLGQALLAQAAVARLDMKLISKLVDELTTHIKRR